MRQSCRVVADGRASPLTQVVLTGIDYPLTQTVLTGIDRPLTQAVLTYGVPLSGGRDDLFCGVVHSLGRDDADAGFA